MAAGWLAGWLFFGLLCRLFVGRGELGGGQINDWA